MSKFATRLKELRESKKLNQYELAEKLNISQSAITKWERDATVPTADNIILIAKFFNVTSDYLLGLTDY